MTVELEMQDSKIESIFPDQDVRVQVGFTTEYAAAVNYGSDPHWPPMSPMVRWTNKLGWENYGLKASQSEDELWAAVDRRRLGSSGVVRVRRRGRFPVLWVIRATSDSVLTAVGGSPQPRKSDTAIANRRASVRAGLRDGAERAFRGLSRAVRLGRVSRGAWRVRSAAGRSR